MMLNPDWIEILSKLNEHENQPWLSRILDFVKDKRDKQAFKASEIRDDKVTAESRNFDIMKELQSIDVLLKESKRSVREFTMGDGEMFKIPINESNEYIDINKHQSKSSFNYSDARNLMAINIDNEPQQSDNAKPTY
mmetsp:Transcript_16779/g.14674  ORF Transcript_16779/g.14674 Transcript_16779/m.14674 type:complete len:137 (-) Transcript_16779:250-660(-)